MGRIDVVCQSLSWGLLALTSTLVGCRQGTEIPEAGALILRIHAANQAPHPDQLRIWIYQDSGTLFDGVRLPSEGTLPITSEDLLGSVLVSPGAVAGNLRIHVRGLVSDARVQDGTLTVPPAMRNQSTVDLYLSVELNPDGDDDGVPDNIDDCAGRANPAQGGCPTTSNPDAETTNDASPDITTDTSVDAGVEADGTTLDANQPTDATTSGLDAPTTDTGLSEANRVPPDASAVDTSAADASAADVPARDAVSTDLQIRDAMTTDAQTGDTVTATDASPDLKPLGSLCLTKSVCQSGFCVDFQCCESACDQPCQACVAGRCQPVTKRVDLPECSGKNSCNPAGKCVSD